MSRSTERALLAQTIKMIWRPDWGQMSWPNIEFVTPKNARWAAFRLVDLDSNRMSLGRDYLKRTYTTLQIDLYAPRNSGTDESKDICDVLEDFFDMRELVTTDGERVTFENPSSRDLNSNQERSDGTDGNWYRRVFEVTFYRDTHVVK